MNATRLTILFALAWLAAAPVLAGAPVRPCRAKASIPHDPLAATQGLFLDNGLLYESTGGYGTSSLRALDPETGRVLKSVRLRDRLYGEGAARVGRGILQLTWLSGKLVLHDPKTLDTLREIPFPESWAMAEGWGLCASPLGLIVSHGGDRLLIADPETLSPVKSVLVRDGDRPVRNLNELEWARGLVLCNVWKSDLVAVVDPGTGQVSAWLDLAGLRSELNASAGDANGLAYDQTSGELFVTGKHWDKIFKIDEWLGPEDQ
ncbi:MAG: glutaminyl-peptide cyclotransferase [Desulfovibrionaceae bacterium]|nr:glutaminyl-peptide cyclotransferase [Desulfovibrionaceae bacterium]